MRLSIIYYKWAKLVLFLRSTQKTSIFHNSKNAVLTAIPKIPQMIT